MKKLSVFALFVLFLVPLAAAEEGNGIFSDISNFLSSASPILLILLGVVLIIIPKIAKFVGMVLVILGLVRLIMMLIS